MSIDMTGTAAAGDGTVAAAGLSGQVAVSPSPVGAIPAAATAQTAKASWIQAAASTKPQDFQVGLIIHARQRTVCSRQ